MSVQPVGSKFNALEIERGSLDQNPYHMNPLNASIVPSAPLYGDIREVEAQEQDYLIGSADTPTAVPITREEDPMVLQARAGSLRSNNFIRSNNIAVAYENGDANLPGRIGGVDIDDRWKLHKQMEDSNVISENSKISEVPRWDPKTDVEGPSPLDNVDYETTNYSLPKEHGIGDPYVFSSNCNHEEYKSVYD